MFVSLFDIFLDYTYISSLNYEYIIIICCTDFSL